MSQRLFNFIAGERRAPSSDAYLTHFNPYTGEPDGEVPDSDLMDVVAAVQAANRALPEWNKQDATARSAAILRLASLIERDMDTFVSLSSRETGQNPASVRTHDIRRAIEVLRWHGQQLTSIFTPDVFAGSAPTQQTFSNRLPGATSGLITTWCEPLFSLMLKLAPALCVGGPVIVKPSSLASSPALKLAELAIEAGFPAGVLNVVCGSGASAGTALVSHPAVPLISFTGRTETGATIYTLAAEQGKQLQMSMGGRNAVAIFGDVDLEQTAEQVARICFDFHHETPLRGSRLFVQDPIYKPFLAALRSAAEKIEVGPLPSAKLKASFEAAIHQSESEKGRALMEGARSPQKGFSVSPFVSVDLTLCSTLQQEEVLGPFVSVSNFKYLHDAIKHINNSPLGQAAYVFSKDAEKARKVAARAEAGQVFVNCGPERAWQDEHYGLKRSGFGPGDGPKALLDFFSRPTRIRFGV